MVRARARNFALTSCPISSLPDHNNSLRLSRPARSLHKPPLFIATFQFLPPTLTFPRYLVFLDIYHKPLSQAYHHCHSYTTSPPLHTHASTIPHSSIRHSYTARAHHHVHAPSHWPRAFPFHLQSKGTPLPWLATPPPPPPASMAHTHPRTASPLRTCKEAPLRAPLRPSPPLPRQSHRAPSS